MEHSQELDKLFTALIEFQNEMPHLLTLRSFSGNKEYLKFEDIKESTQPYLYKHGLGIKFYLEGEDTLVSELYHSSGQFKQARTKIDFDEEKEYRNNKHEDDEFKAEKTNIAKIMYKDILGLTIVPEDVSLSIKEIAEQQPKPEVKEKLSKAEAQYLESIAENKEELKNKIFEHFKIQSFEELPKNAFDKVGDKLLN